MLGRDIAIGPGKADLAGLASLPVIQDELIIQRHVLTDTQLNEAVVITRSTPGAVGLYVVSVGYFVAGVPGAIAGWLAVITPAFLILAHRVGCFAYFIMT